MGRYVRNSKLKRKTKLKRNNKYKARKTKLKRNNKVRKTKRRYTHKYKRRNTHRRMKRLYGGNVTLESFNLYPPTQTIPLPLIKCEWDTSSVDKLVVLLQKKKVDKSKFDIFRIWKLDLDKEHGKYEGLGALELAMDNDKLMAEYRKARINLDIPNNNSDFRNFFEDGMLEFIIHMAYEFNKIDGLPDKCKPPTGGNNTVELSQYECLCILSNSFLDTWKGRLINSDCKTELLGNCCYGQMFCTDSTEWAKKLRARRAPYNLNFRASKCQSLFNYFIERKDDFINNKSRLKTSPVTFTLNTVDMRLEALETRYLCQLNIMPIREADKTLVWPVAHTCCDAYEEYLGRSNNNEGSPYMIDDPVLKHQCLNVDFANKMLGGGSMSYGHVQEEEMFSLHPEYNCGRLFCKTMTEVQAYLLSGAQQFSENNTLAQFTYWNIKPFKDTHPIKLYTTAIDALDFRLNTTNMTDVYTTHHLHRELHKCRAGFKIPEHFKEVTYIRTGKLGGGAFLPDELTQSTRTKHNYNLYKAIIQLCAASIENDPKKIQLDYCAFDEVELLNMLTELKYLLKKFTINTWLEILEAYNNQWDKRSLLDHIRTYIKNTN